MPNLVSSVFAPGPPLFHAPAFALAMLWLATALGRRILTWCRIPFGLFTRWEKGLLCAAIGVGCLQFLPLALGAARLLNPLAVRLAFFVTAALLAVDLLHVGRAVLSAIRDLRGRRPPSTTGLWLVLLSATLAVIFTRALVFGEYGDDDGYHLSSVRRWLAAGTLSYLPTYTHTNAALGFEMLYLAGVAFGNPCGAKLLHFSAGVMTLLGVLLIGKRLQGTLAGVVAVSLLLISSPLYSLPWLMPFAFVDLAVCWLTVCCLLVFLVWRSAPDRKLLLLLATCAGFVASFKFTALSVLPAWALLVVLELRARGLRERAIVLELLLFGSVACLPVAPWLLRNWICTGNPVYPLMASVIPSRDWNAEQASVFGTYIRYYSWGIAWPLSLLWRKVLILGAGIAVVAGSALLVRRLQKPALRSLTIFAACSVVISLALTGLFFRYFLAAILCLCLVVGAIAAERWSERLRAVWMLACGLMAIAFLFTLRVTPHLGHNVLLATGLSTSGLPDGVSLRKVNEYLNHRTPPHARVLMAAFYPTFGLSSFGNFMANRTCFTTDSHLQAYIELHDWPGFLASIQRARIDYVVLSDQPFNFGRHGFSFRSQVNEYTFSRRLVELHGEKVGQFEHLQVYRLH